MQVADEKYITESMMEPKLKQVSEEGKGLRQKTPRTNDEEEDLDDRARQIGTQPARIARWR